MTNSINAKGEQNFYSIAVGNKLTALDIEDVEKAVECGLKMNYKVLLFNLKNVRVIDSRGIGFLANLHKELQKLGGKICLASLHSSVENVIKSCGLSKVLKIFDTVSEAKSNLGGGISIEEKGFYALFALPENFDLSAIALVRHEINRIIAAGYKFFVIDFKDTRFITSVGIGSLINLYKKLKEFDGNLFFLNIPSEVKTLLETTNILKLIDEYKTLEEIEEKIML